MPWMGDAVISPDGRYRYCLRRWDSMASPSLRRRVVFVMLNPSTADALEDDPTIRRCVGFAQRWGSNQVDVVNLFAWRATKPMDLARAPDPVGPDNNWWISEVCAGQDCSIVAAWGSHGARFLWRIPTVLDLVGREMQCLSVTKENQPGHPLMLPYASELKPWIPKRRGME